jgi:hypothetical protein
VDFLTNPYFIAAAVGFVALAAWKLFDQRKDARQKTYQAIADDFALFGQDLISDGFKALARDAYEDFIAKMIALSDRLRKPGGVAEVLCTMIIKSFGDDDFMNRDDVKARLQPVVAKRVLGMIFDKHMKQELSKVVGTLRDFGSKEIADFFSAVIVDDYDGMKASGRSLIDALRDPEKIDDLLMERAKKAIPKLMSMPEHAPVLRALVNATPATTGA